MDERRNEAGMKEGAKRQRERVKEEHRLHNGRVRVLRHEMPI